MPDNGIPVTLVTMFQVNMGASDSLMYYVMLSLGQILKI